MRIFIICVLLGVNRAYDFEDDYNNQNLNKNGNHPFARNRRDVSADECQEEIKSCCNEESFKRIHNADAEIKKECYKLMINNDTEVEPINIYACKDVEKLKKEIACVSQCTGQKKGLIDSEGNVIVEQFLARFPETFSNVEWLMPKIEDFIEKCMAELNEFLENYDTSDGCNPSAIKLNACIWIEIQMNCPADEIQDEEKCNKIREDIRKAATE